MAKVLPGMMHLELKISPEEDPCCHAVSGSVEAEILVHGERGEADIDAIKVAEEINQNGKRQ